MIDMILQKTATSELWWIGCAFAVLLVAWIGGSLFRLFKRIPDQKQAEAASTNSIDQSR